MKHVIYSLLMLVSSLTLAQNFYHLDTIQTIEVTFAQSNWDALLDAEKAGDENYILAQSVTVNGEVFDSVGVKYKGNSTYNPNQTKNPFHIELDTYKDHKYEAYTDIKLSNVAKDPSFLREVLSYEILRNYMDAPLSNYANVYVNGTLIGLYSNSESISKKFVNNRFYSKTNTFIKCNPPEGAGPGSNDFPNLVYLGQDSTDYYDAYEIKSDYGWQELIDLCDTLSNHVEAIEQILDVDRALWMLAFNNMLVNLDSYSGGFAQNYYLYRDDHGRFLPIVWDLNESFGTFSMTGSGNLNGTTAKQQMSHLLHESDANFPLISKLLSVPMYKRMYLAHCKTMLLENFDDGSYFTTGQSLQSIIDASVQADANKFFTYNNFLDNLTSDVGGGGGPGGGSTPGITNLMDGRNSYLLGLSDFTQTEPIITNIAVSASTSVVGDTVTIAASITDEVSVFLGYQTALGAPFNRIEMFDDGTHNDGAAGDGIYGIDLVLTSTLTQYYIYAENNNIGKFSPVRAEHEYYSITATAPNPTVGDLVINEFMASNDTTAADQDGEFDDWIELFNNGTDSIDLSGYFLSDDGSDLTQWAFPAGTVIDAGGYLIIWADDDGDQAGLHANFKLSSSAESIYLTSAADTTVLDQVTYVDQTTDISYGRFPNGTGPYQIMSATFNAMNSDAPDCLNNGGDADGDGVCADIDCDDNDMGIGASQAEGTACDDGDAATENDAIQSDGCTCAGTQIPLNDVVINEFMASNDTTASDQDGEFDDWIELFNNGSVDIDLSGYFLTDNESELTQWEFPAGTTIGAGGYLIIWADDDGAQTGLHANFKLSASQESVLLVNPDTAIVDAVSYVDQTTDLTTGRFPNGTGPFQTLPPTFNAENTTFTSTTNTALDDVDFRVFPNPAQDEITISTIDEMVVISLFNLAGQKVLELHPLQNEIRIDVSNLTTGMYFIHAVTTDKKVGVKKIVIKK